MIEFLIGVFSACVPSLAAAGASAAAEIEFLDSFSSRLIDILTQLYLLSARDALRRSSVVGPRCDNHEMKGKTAVRLGFSF